MYFTLPGLMFTIGIISAIGFIVWQLFFRGRPESGRPSIIKMLLIDVLIGVTVGMMGGGLVGAMLPQAVVVTINPKTHQKQFKDVCLLGTQVDGIKIKKYGAGYIFNLTDEPIRFDGHYFSKSGYYQNPKEGEIAPRTCRSLTSEEFKNLKKEEPSSYIIGDKDGYYYFVY